MARSPQLRIFYNSLWGQLSSACSNATEVALLAAPSFSRPQLATDNGVKDGRYNWLAVTSHPLQASTPYKRHIHGANAIYIARVY